jgi:hypothetical protein
MPFVKRGTAAPTPLADELEAHIAALGGRIPDLGGRARANQLRRADGALRHQSLKEKPTLPLRSILRGIDLCSLARSSRCCNVGFAYGAGDPGMSTSMLCAAHVYG